MNTNVKRVLNIISTIVVAIAIIFAVLLVGVRLFGLQVFTVLSGSMEPEYHTGSLIYVKKVDTTKLKVRDVITFMLNEDTVVTHRIIEVVPSETEPGVVRYRTQGDANKDPDGSLVHYKNVIGTPVFSIPLLGYVSAYIQNPPGTYIAISIGALFLIFVFLPDLFGDSDEDKKKKKNQELSAQNVRQAPQGQRTTPGHPDPKQPSGARPPQMQNASRMPMQNRGIPTTPSRPPQQYNQQIRQMPPQRIQKPFVDPNEQPSQDKTQNKTEQ